MQSDIVRRFVHWLWSVRCWSPKAHAGRIERLDGRFGGVRAAIWRRFTGGAQRSCECDFQVTSESSGLFYDSGHHDRKDGRLGADTWPAQKL